ncbi:hypothetical protein FJZ31_01775 [Candidatus Poribacteria bacterium]|nr:hypothetical protein [Candidatus Poribacteria bacterium]
MDRRKFLKVVGATSAVTLIDPVNIFVREALAAPKFFGLHPFIEAHPEAVFIRLLQKIKPSTFYPLIHANIHEEKIFA